MWRRGNPVGETNTHIIRTVYSFIQHVFVNYMSIPVLQEI